MIVRIGLVMMMMIKKDETHVVIGAVVRDACFILNSLSLSNLSTILVRYRRVVEQEK